VSTPENRCASCGSELPAGSGFCFKCGAPVSTPQGDTAVQELPPSDAGPVPVDPFVVERRLFGVPPAGVLFVICIAASALAILLVAGDHVAWGLLLLALAVLALAAFVSEIRRLPGERSRLTRASLEALQLGRARAGAVVEAVSVQGRARVDLVRLRREVGGLLSTREQLLRELGAAAYDGDRKATKDAKEKLRELDEEIRAKEDEMRRIAADANERIGRAQLQVQPTEVLPREGQAPGPE
jgi:ElaB/YqjD/DUF883 family membrane-anchored ribosome-binding protein